MDLFRCRQQRNKIEFDANLNQFLSHHVTPLHLPYPFAAKETFWRLSATTLKQAIHELSEHLLWRASSCIYRLCSVYSTPCITISPSEVYHTKCQHDLYGAAKKLLLKSCYLFPKETAPEDRDVNPRVLHNLFIAQKRATTSRSCWIKLPLYTLQSTWW